MELSNFEKEVLAVFAVHNTSYPLPEVEDSYRRLKSFDSVLLAMKMAANLGFPLLRATNSLREFIKRRKKK